MSQKAKHIILGAHKKPYSDLTTSERILIALCGGAWVKSSYLHRGDIGGTGARSRISDLNKRGIVIEQRNRKLPNGKLSSEFRLVPDEELVSA